MNYGNEGGMPQENRAGYLLNKQAPASNIPRFNPHGYQEPAQERKPEEVKSPMKMGVVKKRQDKEEIVDFKNFNIEDLLTEMSVQFRNPKDAPGGWLPLEAFDNKELDTRSPKDWMIIKRADENGDSPSEDKPKMVKTEIKAMGLWKDRD